jgi:tetratricopeptide (TPR) repeat protein
MPEVGVDNVSGRAKELYNKGVAAFEKGNFDYSIDLFFSCVEMDPRFLEARRYLRSAEIKNFKKNGKGSMAHVLSSISGMPGYLGSMALLKSGKSEQAVTAAEKLLRKDPLNKKFIMAFVQAASAAGLPEAAVHTLELSQHQYPNDIQILNWLGSLYVKTGKTRSARSCFERLCEICPNDPDALKSLKDVMALDSMKTDGWSQAAEKGGTYRDMIKDTEEATRLEKESKAVKTEQDAQSLINHLEQRIAQEPENLNHYKALARLYTQNKNFDKAIGILDKGLEVTSSDPELDNAKSEIRLQQFDHEISTLRQSGDEEAAQAKENEKAQYLFDSLQERVKLYPNDLKLRFEWGLMLYENEYFNEAIQQFQLAQRSPKYRTRAFYYLAMCFKQKKQYDMAKEQLESASGELPVMDETKKGIVYELGQIAEILGNTDEAARHYKAIYQVDIGYRDIADKVEKVYNQ